MNVNINDIEKLDNFMLQN